MNYVVLDLEWNQSPHGKNDSIEDLPFEIIEIGAVKLDGSLNVVDSFDGFVFEYAKNNNIQFIIRGLRTLTDYQAENQLFEFNYSLSNKDVDTVAFFSDSANSFVSSSIVKEVAQFGGDVSKYVPKVVNEALIKKYSKKD